MTMRRRDALLLEAGSIALAMLRFTEGAAHPSRSATPPGWPRLGAEAYIFAPSHRRVLLAHVPAFLAELPSPALVVPSVTRGVIALLLLDELTGERAIAMRHALANQRAGVDHLAATLGLTEDSSILLEVGGEESIISLRVLRLWSERFAVDIGWNIKSLEDDPRASACLHLIRSDGVDTHGDSVRESSVAITADVPIATHADADMVLAALRRHVPTAFDMPTDAKRVTVWLVLDEHGRVEKTAVSLQPATSGRRTMSEVLLEPFPGEDMRSFERAGTAIIPAGHSGPNHVGVWWLQRRADVRPDPANGVYQFDSLRLLPARSTLEQIVKEHYPAYARAGLTELGEIPLRKGNTSFEPTTDKCIMPWFIANDAGDVLESWLGPYLQHAMVARQIIQQRQPHVSFSSVRIGEIGTENGARAPIVWAIAEP